MKQLAGILIIIAAILSGCTRNDGDIGVWFGTWHVEKITVNGQNEADYEGNVILKFQNSVMESQSQYAHHDTDNCYAMWHQEGMILRLELPEGSDPGVQYGYVPELHLPWLPLIEMKILNLSGKSVELSYMSDNGIVYGYSLKKIY